MLRTILMASAAALIAGAALAAPKHVAPVHRAPAAPLTPLEKAISLARADDTRHAKDEFADPVPIPADIVDQPFRLELPTSHLGTSVSRVYQDGKLTFYVRLEAVPPAPLTPVANWRHDQEIVFETTDHDEGSYVGGNAFGARVKVERSRTEDSALVAVSAPKAETFPGVTSTTYSERTTYPLVLNLSGAEAKALITNARLVIEGTLSPLSNGKLKGCHSRYLEPTVDAPYEGITRTCWAGARIQRIAYVNIATGEVLKEWLAPTTPAAPISVTMKPSDIAMYYPDRAARMGVSGSATLDCHVSARARLEACKVASESPADQGFGDSAIRLARAWTSPDNPPEQDVTFTVNFCR